MKKTVVDSVEDEGRPNFAAEAREIEPNAELGGVGRYRGQPAQFGRIAAQTAKQVITQRIREAERDSVYAEYADRVGELINGTVRNVDARSHNVVISMGKAEALLPRTEQIPGEHYRFGQRLRVYLMDTERTGHGPQITVSRTHRDLLRRLLELEVPEIYNGTVEIKSIAREPGSRSKVAVHASQPGVDPVGSCVGMRGVRSQNIVNELNGEKIDVVAWSADVRTFIANALSPAKVFSVDLNDVDKTARVVVPDRSLSLAIGKEGQNARLAAKLTGWRIDIKNETEAAAEAEQFAAEREQAAQRAEELEAARRAAAELLAAAEAGLDDEESDEVLSEEAIEAALSANSSAFVGEPEAGESLEVEAPAGAAISLTEEPAPTEAEAVSVEAAAEASIAEAAEVAATGEMAGVESLPSDQTLVPEVEEATVAMQSVSEKEVGEVLDTDEIDGEAEELLPDEDGEERKDRRSKDRSRQLEFDERQGRVVARKRRKENRRQQNWEDGWDEDV